MSRSALILEDKTIFQGKPFGAPVDASGEIVFNTGMVGYPETLTDPSYRGQILVLTYPLIGNYGVANYKSCKAVKLYSAKKPTALQLYSSIAGFESDRIQIVGLIVSGYCSEYSHPFAKKSLAEWLKSERVPAIEGIDTRALTEKLREKGTMLGKISKLKSQISNLHLKSQNFDDPNARNLAAEVSCKEPIIYEPEISSANSADQIPNSILLYDCGVKLNIIRSLLKRGCRIIRVPWNYEFSYKALKLYSSKAKIDGIVISNGPGDPIKCDKTIEQIKKITIEQSNDKTIPILGICLGNQILALAAGAKTYKLKYGHRGQNQPVLKFETHNLKLETQNQKEEKFQVSSFKFQAFITSQNHGYAVDEKTLPSDWNVWFKNLNDGTVEGIRHKSKPWMAVQFHPEAAPGPTDTEWIFDEWLSLLH